MMKRVPGFDYRLLANRFAETLVFVATEKWHIGGDEPLKVCMWCDRNLSIHNNQHKHDCPVREAAEFLEAHKESQ